ncbi:MAG: HAD hydrolase-like protein, partial [Alphaproteobacteria bacterium]|nr:HAD hydrolase-like protein [Alphaproteobacteria bacterium]
MALLIFDCDGVLVDSEILHAQIEVDLGKELLGINRSLWQHHAIFSGTGMENVYNAWARECGKPLPPGLSDEMARRKNEAFEKMLKPIPHMADTLSELTDIPRCVASGTPLPTLEVELRSTGLFDFFAPNFFSSTSVARGKPAPDVFLYAAEKMGADPKD